MFSAFARRNLAKFYDLVVGRWPLQSCSYSMKHSDIKMLIAKNTEVSRNHLTPEIALHLITPSCTLWKAQIQDCPFKDPFWAFYWPGGQAVTRFILDNSSLFQGLSVIDVGSGCGASAIAASMCGARVALANDIDPVACIAAEMNSALNGALISTCSDNHIKEEVEIEKMKDDKFIWDVVIIGDLFYDAEISQRVMTWTKRCSSTGAMILIGDPGRYTFKSTTKIKDGIESNLSGLTHMKTYPLPELCCLENNGFSHASVWKMDSNVR